MSDYSDLKIKTVVLIILLILLFLLRFIDKTVDTTTYNNGYCECGGKWIYQQAIGHGYTTNYIYKCDKCGRIKEFSTVMETE